MKTKEEIIAIIDEVKFLDRSFRLMKKGDGYLIQLAYMEEDIITGKRELQKSRKHYISPHMTTSEIVETMLLCAERSMMHVVHEHFLFAGRRVYSPHFSVNARMRLCDEKAYDKREPPKPVY